MNKTLALIVIAAISGAVRGPADDLPGVPATTNVPGQDYPRILPDLSVAFRIKFPGAQSVLFDVGNKRYTAVKDSDGIWTATSNPQVPGFHYYWMVVDGLPLNDPASETFYGVSRETSGIEIPEAGVDYYEVAAIHA